MKRILSGAVGLVLILFAIGFVASAAKADPITRPVGEAGVVTFTTDGGVLAFVGAESADGWTYTVDRQDGSHLKVTFRDATGSEVEFEVELEDGAVTFGGAEQSAATEVEESEESEGEESEVEESEVEESEVEESEESEVEESEVEESVTTTAEYAVGPAGAVSVLFVGDEVSLAGITIAEGWTYTVDHAGGSHVSIEFQGPEGAEIEFRVDADGEFELEG